MTRIGILAFMHSLELLRSPSGHTLEERDDEGEDSQRSERSDTNQGESPERLSGGGSAPTGERVVDLRRARQGRDGASGSRDGSGTSLQESAFLGERAATPQQLHRAGK